jgi:hypothetical protein
VSTVVEDSDSLTTVLPVPLSPFPHSIPSEPKTVHVVYCANNFLNFQHPIDHRSLGQLCKDNWNRPFRKSLRCRDQTGRFSRGYPRTAPRTREGVQGLSGKEPETNRLPQPGRKCHSGVLGRSRRGGQPGKSHIPSGDSFKVISTGPLPTSKGVVRWDRCPPLCSSL